MTEPQAPASTFSDEVFAVLDQIGEMLVAKNQAYGDSALDPLRVFSRLSPEQGLCVRIDDKLSRLARGSAAGEDAELDLLGYLVMLRVLRARKVQP